MSNRTLASWPARMGRALSQLLNVLLNGNEDESFSSRSWKARAKGKAWGKIAVPLIDAVFGKGHCQAAAEWDEL
jgi:hypothetical protein